MEVLEETFCTPSRSPLLVLGRGIDTSSTWLNVYVVCVDEGYQRGEEEQDGGERKTHGGSEREGVDPTMPLLVVMRWQTKGRDFEILKFHGDLLTHQLFSAE